MTARLIYTIPQAADELGYDSDTVYRFIADGLLVARRLRPRGHLRIAHADLVAFVASAEPVVPLAGTDAPPEPASVPVRLVKPSRQRVVRLVEPFATPAAPSARGGAR